MTIEWHWRLPYPGDPYYEATAADVQARVSQYGVGSSPEMRFDGTKEPAWTKPTQYQITYDICSAVESPVGLDSSGIYDAAQRSGIATVTITPDAPLAGSYRLFAALTESEIYDPFPNGIDDHYDVIREWLGPQSGVITFSGSSDDPLDVVVPFSLGSGWAAEHVKLVYFVQDETTSDVAQAGVIAIPELTPGTPVSTTSWSGLKVRF